MKLTFLGTAAGTEPIAGYHHTAFALEQGDQLYWFDAGEACGYNAHLHGLDLLKVRAIFISHPHMDHVGGLANLFWYIAKLTTLMKPPPPEAFTNRTIHLRVPQIEVWEGVERLLTAARKGRVTGYHVDAQRYHDGLVYEDENLRVTAMHNHHLGEPEPGEPWRSFSLRIANGRRTVVFSGDVRDVSELEPLLDGCDLLLMETGHHKVENVCTYLRDRDGSIGRLGFVHHGRAILSDPDAELRKARDILGPDVFLAEEGKSITLE